ncbi:alternative ribosome rescue aminoacyl-tRNA hydrolase ArfB [Pelagicoccus sp. SDUM812002]|uniref:alternative ribosome rescue aminoacyl-tRNA hydrolase ArfB n=1 Tax=Pelagicoccus sp. SDUM812002 TaxID=3041266 RepID=UPI00280E4B3A|nr:alternative ribosome rescue aminoacyl-tRNA hydrolase ArfB [Pelagicoccus sp. SDUM812002]MDQ8186603.1 alternative ribosome rescue aminoacyl-tRNA hydrolase ArfB [Pelagicoccus sp. SDUM812002]
MLRVSSRIGIPLKEIEIKAIRAQGSGGQHVNKVSTAIQLFFDIRTSSLPPAIKNRLLERKDHRISDDGLVVIKSQDSRSQEANKEAALARLSELVASVLVAPKKRRPTKPTRGAKERRLKGKSIRGKTKSLRGRPKPSD